MKLVDIVALALAVFETSVAKALNNGWVDKHEFTMLQTFHLDALNKLANIYGSRDQNSIAGEKHSQHDC